MKKFGQILYNGIMRILVRLLEMTILFFVGWMLVALNIAVIIPNLGLTIAQSFGITNTSTVMSMLGLWVLPLLFAILFITGILLYCYYRFYIVVDKYIVKFCDKLIKKGE